MSNKQCSYKFAIFMWFLAAVFFLYEFFLRVFPNTLHGEIVQYFNINPTEFALIGSAFYLAYSSLQVPVGILIEKLGVRLSLTGASLVCTLGLLIFLISSNLYIGLVGRLLMGAGAAFGFIGLLTVSVMWFPKRFIGLLAGSTQILGAMGPILAGGPLYYAVAVSGGNWHYVLGLVIIAGLLLTAGIFAFVRDNPDYEFQHQQNVLHMIKEVLGNRKVWLIAVYAFFVYAAVPTLGAVWGMRLMETADISRGEASMATSSLWLGLAISSPLFGAISDRFTDRINALTMVSIIGIGATVAIITLPMGVTGYSICLFLVSCAASGQTLSFSVLAENIPQHIVSVAFGVNNTMVMLSGVIIPVLIGNALDIGGITLIAAMVVLPLCFIIALVMSLLIKYSCRKAA